MNFTLCSPSSKISYCCDDGLRFPDVNLPVSKPHRKAGKFSKKDDVRLPNHELRKVAVSGHAMPGHVEGSILTGKKQFVEHRKELDCVRTLLIDNYDSYTYNIYQELSTVNGVPPMVIRNDEWTWEEACHYLCEVGDFDNIVISPGPGSPSCPADIGICLQLLRECWGIPILGVCLGHQALGYVHGGSIVHAPEAVHGRLSGIEHDGSRLFLNIPSDGSSGFKVVRYHSLVIDPESLSKDIIPIAWTSSSDVRSFVENQKSDIPRNSIEGRKRNVVMGIKHSTRPHYGVQLSVPSGECCNLLWKADIQEL